MRTIELTDSQAKNLMCFLEREFIPSIQRSKDNDIEYFLDMCNVYDRLKRAEQRKEDEGK